MIHTLGFWGAAAAEIGVKAPPGFEVVLFADDNLASNIYTLTIDSFGRVVVSGPGYVRILIDEDGDGRADFAKQFADGPRSGAQGMSFYGRDLLCTGDGGLIRYRDADGDDRVDGPPEMFIEARTGGEHDIHAIRQGPDGWWYLVAGNMAGISAKYVTLPNSPVTQPEAGTLLRFKPDLTGGEVMAHGFRNAYDFDFHTEGDLFTFDSDGERDISLPWYRPTRVFHVLPGSHAGWLSRSWKRPDGFFDMPPVVAAFGRGSPTGVVCYRHTQFPPQYRGAVFVLDWTYGRVMTVQLSREGSGWRGAPAEFLTAVGQFGFAPTDAAVGPDGSLYVSVGGRGTRGGVYRIRWTSPDPQIEPNDDLARCLTAPQPLASWSRRIWEPRAARLGAGPFQQAAEDPRRPDAERIRAIEILTEKFGGLPPEVAGRLSSAPSAAVRARAAWSLGCSSAMTADTADDRMLGAFLRDNDPFVARMALEALQKQPADVIAAHAETLPPLLAHTDRFVRHAAARVLARVDETVFRSVAEDALQRGWQAAVQVGWVYAIRHEGFDEFSMELGRRILASNLPLIAKEEAARLVQIALGDVGPAEGVEPAFDGYTPYFDLQEHTAALEPLRQTLRDLYPTSSEPLDHELGRLIAMLETDDETVFAQVLGKITADSSPVDDLHQLIIAARMPVERTAAHRQQIADALLALEFKMERQSLNRDSNWADRLIEMYIAHADHDPELPAAILEHPELGHPGHVPFVLLVDENRLEEGIDRFVNRIRTDPDYRWTNDLIYLLGESGRPEVRQLLRSKADDFSLRPAVLVTLAESPQAADRPLFVSGLDMHDLGVLSLSVQALEALGPDDGAAEQVALVRTLRRLGPTQEERSIQDALIRVLRRNTGQQFGYELGASPGNPQSDPISQWTAWVRHTYPDEWSRQTGSATESLADLKSRLEAVDWSAGDAARGEQLFHTRSCSQCHGSSRALGPDLRGVTGRFSRQDLFTAIALPNQDVAPRYQATVVVTVDGKIHTGLVIYESVDGLVLRTGTNQTLRFETEEIDARRRMTTSLMPTGLLNDLRPTDLADLYAYLQTLGETPTTAGGRSSR